MPRKKSVVEEPIPSGENVEALEAEAAVETQSGDLPSSETGGEPLNPEGMEPSQEDGYPFAEEELEPPQQEGFSEEAPPEIPVQEEASLSAESEEGNAFSPEVPSALLEAEPAEIPAAEEEAPAPAQEPPASKHPPEEPEKPDRPSRAPSFFDLNYNQLDRDLSPEERQEWNSIYASYRSRSLLTGEIIGVDEHSFTVRDKTTGEVERKTVQCAIVIAYRVKVLIPETDMWFSSTEARPGFVLRNMVGAKIDYVILQVDREGGIAVASRRMALGARRYQMTRLSALHRPDALTPCRVLSVGPRRCLVECHGYDIGLTQREMRYTAIPDLRTEYRPGQELDCRIKHYDPEQSELKISVKEVHPHPFEGAELRHPVGSRRQAVIAGKYAGGVFCNLPDGTVCMSLYSARYDDADFKIGDKVIIVIRQYDNAKKQIYGKIISKW